VKNQDLYFHKLFENSPVGIYVTKPDGSILYANMKVLEMLGFSSLEELQKRNQEDLMNEYVENRNQFIKILKDKGEVNGFETSWQKKDKSLLYIRESARVNYDESGNLLWYEGVVEDITDEKILDTALHLSEEKYKLLYDNSNNAIFIHDLAGQIIDVNISACEMIGFSKEKLRDKKIMDLHPPDYKEEVPGALDTVEQKGSYYKISKFRKSNGSVIDVEISSSIIPFEKAIVQGIVRDITEKKKAEAKIQILNRDLEKKVKQRTMQLESANKELESFSYSVSHDLRAPLRHIESYTDLLEKRSSDKFDDNCRKYLQSIRSASRKMDELINDLLSLSRTSTAEMRLIKIDMNALVREVISEFKEDTSGRDIQYVFSNLGMVTADPNLLRQVMINLVSNAIKYTTRKKKARIEIGLISSATEDTVYIKDNGAGFDMKYEKKLFGVFQRLHDETEFEGTGIGLANVKRIITRHDGRIWAESILNEGASFSFTLPRHNLIISEPNLKNNV